MVRHIDAIFSHGAFQPVEPLTLPEVARVRLRVVEALPAGSEAAAPIIRSPKLAHPENAADFVLEVREAGDAGLCLGPAGPVLPDDRRPLPIRRENRSPGGIQRGHSPFSRSRLEKVSVPLFSSDGVIFNDLYRKETFK
jgi:hypothetical protein